LAQSPHGDALKIDCTKCHTSESWKIDTKAITFDHNTTGFTLLGSHAKTDCIECHKTLVFNEASNKCASCHTDMHNATVGNDCARCHTPKSWVVTNIPQLHEENGFPLVGSHKTLNCIECHKSETNLRFDRIGNECINCHRETFNNTTNPNHVTGNYSKNCIECHNPQLKEWTPSDFNHDFFPLTQGHNVPDCNACHTTNNFADAKPECISCHQTTFDNTVNPKHTDALFDTDCKVCHTTSPGWKPATFDHNFFPLTKGHDVQNCNACHATTPNYTNTPNDCVACHQTNFNSTTNPNHITNGFPTDCVSCHTTNPGWTPSTFNHNSFPLTQGHNIPDCKQCHITANFSDAKPDCVSCHQTTYNNAVNPNHVAAGFDTNCVSCHTTTPGWKPTTFDHSSFPLTLGHNLTDCTQCHIGGNYNNTSPTCVSCHQTTYNNAVNPNHVAAGFPTDCVSCHNTNPGWKPTTFDHSSFPLTLGHNLTDCTQCHIGGNYNNTSPTCVSCHQTTYNNAVNPNHVAAGFPTDCIACHTTNPGWTPATFNHTNFPLTLGHNITDCTQCHKNGNYTNTSPDCVSCHQTTYNNTTNPNHVTSGFSTDCITCHTTNPNWTPSTFNHDAQYFPIYSGKHQGEWTNCNECHTTPNNLSTFSCIICHEHSNQASLASDHKDVSGYTYVSSECFRCHPTGRKD